MYAGRRSDEEGESQPKQTSIDYHPDAIDELIDAAHFYEECQIGLGHRFLDAVDVSLTTIQRHPLIGRADELGRRKYQVRKFPYVLIYKINNNCVYILAVAHTSRKPGYWKLRDT